MNLTPTQQRDLAIVLKDTPDYQLAGRQAIAGSFASIDAQIDAQMRATVRDLIERNQSRDAHAAANRAEERRAGLDSSPRGTP